MAGIRPRKVALGVVVIICLSGGPAAAYVGPGAGLSAIGTFLALIGGIILAIFGFIWYPIKRIIRKFRKTDVAENSDADGVPE